VTTLYLTCAICRRKQAEGLLSGATWGKALLPPDSVIAHPAVRHGHVRACPACVGRHRNWELAAFTAIGIVVAS
jgi:hypothetical protein